MAYLSVTGPTDRAKCCRCLKVPAVNGGPLRPGARGKEADTRWSITTFLYSLLLGSLPVLVHSHRTYSLSLHTGTAPISSPLPPTRPYSRASITDPRGCGQLGRSAYHTRPRPRRPSSVARLPRPIRLCLIARVGEGEGCSTYMLIYLLIQNNPGASLFFGRPFRLPDAPLQVNPGGCRAPSSSVNH